MKRFKVTALASKEIDAESRWEAEEAMRDFLTQYGWLHGVIPRFTTELPPSKPPPQSVILENLTYKDIGRRVRYRENKFLHILDEIGREFLTISNRNGKVCVRASDLVFDDGETI